MVEPHEGTLAGVNLYGQGDEAEQGAQSKQGDAKQEHTREALNAQDANEQYPRHIFGFDIFLAEKYKIPAEKRQGFVLFAIRKERSKQAPRTSRRTQRR